MQHKINNWSDWEYAKNWLTARIIPFNDTSPKALSGRPYQVITNTSTAVVWDLISWKFNYVLSRTPVTWDLIQAWDVTMDDIWEVSSEMTPRIFPAVIQPINHFLPRLPKLLSNDIPMIVVTNQATDCGAIAICYKNAASKIRELLGGDFYILPSSIHETLCIRKQANPEHPQHYSGPQVLLSMVIDVNNSDNIAPEDVLTDDVWEFRDDLLVSALHAYDGHPVSQNPSQNLISIRTEPHAKGAERLQQKKAESAHNA